MKRTYESPLVTDLGSVSEMTRGMGGDYGEFVQPGGLGMRHAHADAHGRRRRLTESVILVPPTNLA